MIKKLIFLTFVASVFAIPQNGGWLGSIYSFNDETPSAPERPVILLTHEDQTTDCCEPFDILPEQNLKKCVNSMTNSSLTDIELHKCILDCFTNSTKIISRGKISERQVMRTFKFPKEVTKNKKLLKEVIKNCTTAANNLKKSLPATQNDATCSPVSTLLTACVAGNLLKRCPSTMRVTTNECGLQFDAMKNCDVYLLPKLN